MLLVFLGACLCASGVFLLLTTVFHAGIMMVLFLGVLLLLTGLFLEPIQKMTSHGILRWLKYLVYAGFLFLLLLNGVIIYTGNHDTIENNEDVILVLGSSLSGNAVSPLLARRLDAALFWHEKNPDALIAVSGGQGPEEPLPEGEAMKNYLMEQGIPEEKILVEDKATSTYENFVNTKKLLENQFGEHYKLAFVTSDFHVFRASRLAEIAGLRGVTHGHSSLRWFEWAVNITREWLAIGKMWILRC